MCGIVGVANFSKQAIGNSELNIFQQLLIADSARGMDGTGIFKVLDTGLVEWRKCQGHPFVLMSSKGFSTRFYDPIIKSQFVRFLVGHNRFGTTGSRDTKSAHPFNCKHITLVHNGTVTAACTMKELKEYKVDSEAICAAIADRGIDKIVKEMWGPFSIVYFDSNEKTLNLIRNYGRPMFVGAKESRSLLLFGSEEPMLKWVADRNNVTDISFKATPVDTLVSWKLDEIKPTLREIKPYTYSGPSYGHGYNGWQGDNTDMWDYEGGSMNCYSDSVSHLSSEASKSIPSGTYIPPPKQAEEIKKEPDPVTDGKTNISQFPTMFERYKPIQEARGYKRGGKISFDVYDHECLASNPNKTIVYGGMEDIPEFTLKCNVFTGKEVDHLVMADKVYATIAAIVIDMSAPLIKERHQVTIHCINPKGISLPKKEVTEVTEVLSSSDTEETLKLIEDQGMVVIH